MTAIFHPATGLAVSSIDNIARRAEWLSSFCSDRGFTVDTTTPLGGAISDAIELTRRSHTFEKAPRAEVRAIIRTAIGLSFFVGAIQEASALPSFEGLERLLPRIISADPAMPKKAGHTMERSLAFEMLIGSLMIIAGYAVQSEEPDLVISESTGRWNLACKMVYSTNRVTRCNLVEDGIRQSLDVEGDFALVVIGLSESADHDSFLPILGDADLGRFTPASAADRLIRYAGEFVREIQAEIPHRFIRGREDRRFRGFLTFAQVISGQGPIPSCDTNLMLVQRGEFYSEPSVIGPEREMKNRLGAAMSHLAP